MLENEMDKAVLDEFLLINDPYRELVQRFLDENPEYLEEDSCVKLSVDNLAGVFESLEDVIDYFPDYWEDRYDGMSPLDIAHEWSENDMLITNFEGRWLVFTRIYG